MSKSASESRIRELNRQLEAEKAAHARTRNQLQQEITRVWRLVPAHYINLMGVYPPLRRLLHVLAEAADLQDPSKGVDYENTMRTEYTPDGETLTQTERAVLTYRHHRYVVSEMGKELDWVTHKLSKLIPGSEVEYHPPSSACLQCGDPILWADTGRKRQYCSERCRKRASRNVTNPESLGAR